ncbi:MAG TPA: hypothetical protein VKD71_13980 [Gemmataceae bacterium]|nr:hypothetical protein [Gemmataceae bacterium]
MFGRSRKKSSRPSSGPEPGKVSQYQAGPEYQEEDFVPIAIKITASESGEFITTISIWGEALEQE